MMRDEAESKKNQEEKEKQVDDKSVRKVISPWNIVERREKPTRPSWLSGMK